MGAVQCEEASPQVHLLLLSRTFVEMDSHEEKVYQAVRATQEREAKQTMRERAKELQVKIKLFKICWSHLVTVIWGYSDTFLTGLNCSRT